MIDPAAIKVGDCFIHESQSPWAGGGTKGIHTAILKVEITKVTDVQLDYRVERVIYEDGTPPIGARSITGGSGRREFANHFLKELTYPRTTVDGRTVWACCESSIGPVCGHLRPPD